MRTPLQDVLDDRPELAEAGTRQEAEQHLEIVFQEAQTAANAYAAERLREVYEVAERGLTLGGAFAAAQEPSGTSAQPPFWQRIPSLVARYGAGVLLAITAPLVADSSVLLASVCGLAAVLSLALPGHKNGSGGKIKPRPLAKAAAQKFEGLITAADRSLLAMTSAQALPAPPSSATALGEDDVLSLIQDLLASTRSSDDEGLKEIGANASRLARRAGFEVVWEGEGELFEVMIDPEIRQEMLLKPALRHREDPQRSAHGVVVKARHG